MGYIWTRFHVYQTVYQVYTALFNSSITCINFWTCIPYFPAVYRCIQQVYQSVFTFRSLKIRLPALYFSSGNLYFNFLPVDSMKRGYWAFMARSTECKEKESSKTRRSRFIHRKEQNKARN
ncbi:hypothetical protein R3W88_028206 [Solanum pinnatisectum]|uniref:Uncharacterized protein n=1 Tax=Solanum pinnatisectum TaxID=50273 RepID=A0AAV9LM15_9SOLN|nr:hypothetical protein R3W88_028206 [Solanum pinnatisectum]